MTINEAKLYSNRVYEEIWKLWGGTDCPVGYKINLFVAYCSLVLEHQKAIVELVDLELKGSAFALFRSQVEAMYRGLWVNRIANEQQIENIAKNDADPFRKLHFKNMVKQVDEAYQANGLLLKLTENRGWKILNEFTHSGYEQLVRRSNSNGIFEPSYSDAETEALLAFSGNVSILMAIEVFSVIGISDKTESLREWAKNNRPKFILDLQEGEAIDQ
jgi:hypothetical protein